MKFRIPDNFQSFLRSAYKGQDTKQTILRIACLCIASLLIFILVLAILVRLGLFGRIPTTDQVKAIKNPVSSVVLDDDKRPIGKYFIENRTNVNFNSIAPHVIQALIATEDQRFYQHHGIDIRSWLRVFFKTLLLSNESSGGGSTISQQLAKNLYPRKNLWILSMPVNKLREMMIAKRLESSYTKEEILTLYLNTVSFGSSIYGIDVACKQLFNTTTENISTEDGAVLIGMLKATGVYNPLKNEERSLQRRNTVLNQMFKNGFLNQTELDSISLLPINVKYKKEGHNEGLATYFRENMRQELNRLLKGYTKPDGSPYNLYTDGLKIYTTLDASLQRLAEEAVHDRMAKLQNDFNIHWKKKDPWDNPSFVTDMMYKSDRYIQMKKGGYTEEEIKKAFDTKMEMSVFGYPEERDTLFSPMDSLKYYLRMLHAGFIALDHKTGKLKAWVGGVDHHFFKYDHVKSKRQVGSTFKPIVMAAALQQGYTPCDYFANQLIIYNEYDHWEPHNSDDVYGGYYSMEGTLVKSVNCATVDAIIQVGTKPVITLAKKLGIKSDLPAVPSLALGTADISLLEMVQSFGVFANKGKRNEPYYLKRIENNRGELIIDFEKDRKEAEGILTNDEADMMVKMLQSVVESGTARGLRSMYNIAAEIGGKTGTTQNQTDGWLIAITPALTVGSWVGGEMPQIRFRSMAQGQGSYTALPICGSFLYKVFQNKSLKKYQTASFSSPSDDAIAQMGCPYYIEDENDFDTLPAEGDTSMILLTEPNKHIPDTVKDIRIRRRNRENDQSDIGKFLQRLFKKKEKRDSLDK